LAQDFIESFFAYYSAASKPSYSIFWIFGAGIGWAGDFPGQTVFLCDGDTLELFGLPRVDFFSMGFAGSLVIYFHAMKEP
jgi:hypothetical protein